RTNTPKATCLPVAPATTRDSIPEPASPGLNSAPPQTNEQETSSHSGLLDKTTAAIGDLLCQLEALPAVVRRAQEMLRHLHAMLAPSHPPPATPSTPSSPRDNNHLHEHQLRL